MNIETAVEYLSHFQHVVLTSVADSSQDLDILCAISQVAFAVAAQLYDSAPSEDLLPVVQTCELPDGGMHRVVTNTYLSLSDKELAFVGFLSKKQARVADEVQQNIANADKNMLAELARQPGLLSYSSLQLADGNWCNLVIFAQDAAKQGITRTALHQHAAFTLAPQYYQWVRLHHGVLHSHGVTIELHIHLTKQYSFQDVSEQSLVHDPVLATPGVAAL